MALLDERDGPYASWFLFESNFDTTAKGADEAANAHLQSLAHAQSSALGALFSHCEGFSANSSAEALAEALIAHRAPATVCYQGHTNRDLARIRLEQHLREVVMTYLTTCEPLPPVQLFQAIRSHVRLRVPRDPKLAGLNLDGPSPPEPSAELRTERLRAGKLPWVANIAPAVPLLMQLPRIFAWDKEDTCYDLRQQERWTDEEKQRYREVAASEDYGAQNALTHIVPLRGGAPARLAVLRAAHAYISRMAERHFNDIGQLGGIPSIHFAKWLLTDDHKRLLFLSNYDSSWESYLGDFIDQAAIGLNLAWSCTEGYPRTRLLFDGGANDEERFKAWGRAHQRPTHVFYSAYPDLSVAAVNNNSWIRIGLHSSGTPDVRAWLRRLT